MLDERIDQCGVCSAVTAASLWSRAGEAVIDKHRQDLGGVSRSADLGDSLGKKYSRTPDEPVGQIEIEPHNREHVTRIGRRITLRVGQHRDQEGTFRNEAEHRRYRGDQITGIINIRHGNSSAREQDWRQQTESLGSSPLADGEQLTHPKTA
ncbi:hypothetical protein GCM10009764_83470 [Nocardia ninae]|uniref:Uncharacterized protein n=1 Tax=Nocardia ninae NBRC 108245 TaxID=1210091 RepID=A0A511M7U2_9NOCA|nr:hypothetical protein NN4_12330 [Nocardia ninae NBRC 108245]